jgi:hypothetical protein
MYTCCFYKVVFYMHQWKGFNDEINNDPLYCLFLEIKEPE